ncbi:MAG: family 10 glycosylhydrolase [Candidatus Omnitrophica bacterium]|nr:family 10 glycosylhydrolase [Candidatus Omnitrophota bacterium]
MHKGTRIFWYGVCLLFLAVHYPAVCEDTSSRGLFVTVIQDPPVLSSRTAIESLVTYARSARIDTLFVQIYRANRAYFPSRIADPGPYEQCRVAVGEDPFRLLIDEAHKNGIRVHAWLNMLSLSENKDARILKKYGTGILTRNLKTKRTIEDYKIDNQYFLEPGDPRVRRELAIVVGEVLRAYPALDGIQFDYIRYPDKAPHYGYTGRNIERFKKATGRQVVKEKSRGWKDWKRAQVTEFLEQLVMTARSIRPDIQVSTTGCAPYIRAYQEAFQDWPSWLNRRLIDFVTLMSYAKDPSTFGEYIEEARKRALDFKRVNVAVGAYVLVNAPEAFKKEVELCEKAHPGTCVIFHYGSLLQNPLLGDFLVKTNIVNI